MVVPAIPQSSPFLAKDANIKLSHRSAGAVYIHAGSHFLAVKVNKPSELLGDENGEIEIPPIQFACETASRSYPMVISRISAAEETEVTIYTLARHRMEGSNVANATIDPDAVSYDASTSSQTNYETPFRQTIESQGGLALITEFASQSEHEMFWRAADWPDAPPGAADLQFLTRMRTVVARERLERDFQFRDASEDAYVSSIFSVQAEPQHAAGAVGYLLVVGLGLGASRAAFRKWAGNPRREHRSTGRPRQADDCAVEG